ncbi:MAG: hypothetical protein C3F17_05890 [Bradyrhizobiaceae bacterium]|nr:MAG: hypothetical protein C3F17_05890 [Bradyrhizobiaceae bacterium]
MSFLRGAIMSIAPQFCQQRAHMRDMLLALSYASFRLRQLILDLISLHGESTKSGAAKFQRNAGVVVRPLFRRLRS